VELVTEFLCGSRGAKIKTTKATAKSACHREPELCITVVVFIHGFGSQSMLAIARRRASLPENWPLRQIIL
jgi:hypothetical protein